VFEAGICKYGKEFSFIQFLVRSLLIKYNLIFSFFRSKPKVLMKSFNFILLGKILVTTRCGNTTRTLKIK